ncbi:hypothetical protein KQ304_09705 [Synechococcus sp. CS-1329]|uniref:ribbon-helix-helix domain-containing protein n=1 Tax=Synechococcus sp. CS-1329 TaxID=2847975 RepID=UPI00223A9844|nr:hypothetical protein [Synechococcus sp. CS-1329]MCT0219270.1 hypothetical protein [Synechococcus sp. CS-1329]
MATRQTSTSGRPKSPRIQVVLPEELCDRLTAAAEAESRTVSNMAKVLIQRGLESLEQAVSPPSGVAEKRLRREARPTERTERFREVLERQERREPRRLRGLPRRLRLPRS